MSRRVLCGFVSLPRGAFSGHQLRDHRTQRVVPEGGEAADEQEEKLPNLHE